MTALRAVWHEGRPLLGFLVAPPATARLLRVCSGIAAREGYGGVVVAGWGERGADARVLPDLPTDVVIAWEASVEPRGGVEVWTLGQLAEGGHRVFRMGTRGYPKPTGGAKLVEVQA